MALSAPCEQVMIRFLAHRLLETIPLLVLLSLLVFTLFEMIPGDYLSEMELDPAISAETVSDLRQSYGLDDPFYLQYFKWISQVLRGNLGYSFAQQRPAVGLIFDRLGNTLVLALGALFLTFLISIPIAVVSALKTGGWLDRVSLVVSLFGLSIPTVLTSVAFLYLAFWTDWFAIGGRGGLRHLFLPCVALALPLVAFFFRTLRLELIDALQQPYVLSAAGRGLPQHRVVYHGFRNAINPLISMTGLLLGGLLSGSIVVEKVFSWPGLGALTVNSILDRDLFVALNCVLVASVLVVVSNLVADVVLALNDPRVRYR
jgi:peptide/nickel transport system permease protein